jgi:hypothetical protein
MEENIPILAVILVDNDKGRAGYGIQRFPPAGNALDQSGLSRAQVAGQADQIALGEQ